MACKIGTRKKVNMEFSPTIENISKALIGFQSEIGKLEKSANNPFFKSKYVPLQTILDAIKQPLINNGLSFVQFPDGTGLTTTLLHESGEYFTATYQLAPAKEDPQGWGAAITYARRYALTAILGLNTDEDDDGNRATVSAEFTELMNYAVKNATNREELADIFTIARSQQKNPTFIKLFKERGEALKNG